MSRDTFNFRYFTTNLRLFIVLLAMMALPMGCAKVQPEPFTQFESITGQGSILVAAIVKRDTANLRKMYIARQANNPNFNTDSLKLHYSGNFILDYTPHNTTSGTLPTSGAISAPPTTQFSDKNSNIPLYLEAQRSELALAGFNSSFAAYVHALSQLSSDKAISESNLNATKAGFEQSFGTASELLSILDKPGVSSNLSQILTAGVRAFLEYKQRRDIIRIIDAWQIVVDSYASQCQSLLNFSATIYHSDYQVMFDSLQGELEGYILSRNPGKSETKIIAQRARIIESMLDINDKLLAEFAGMSALYQYYGLVPAAHDALGKNLERHVINTSSLDTLIAYAKNIVELYKSITAKSQPAPPTAGQQAAS